MKKENSNFNEFSLLLFVVLSITLGSCTYVEIITPENEILAAIEEEIDTTNTKIHVDQGSVGLVIDTRKIFKKGYVATKAKISFQDYGKFNTELDIDEYTNLAIFSVLNDSLSAEEKTSFANGTPLEIIITDTDGTLTTYNSNNQVLDSSNLPLKLQTDKEYIKTPLTLNEEIPYLIMVENISGVLSTDDFIQGNKVVHFKVSAYDLYNSSTTLYQQFYFQPVYDNNNQIIDNKFKIRLKTLGLDDGFGWMGLYNECGETVDDIDFNCTSFEVTDTNEENAAIFELVTYPDGWSKIRLAGSETATEMYGRLFDNTSGFIQFNSTNTPDRFRLIADNIEWHIEDLGTTYNQPIIKPAKLDFAYKATLKNCSSAELTEEIGRTESKSRTTTFSTTESLQLFSSESYSYGLTLGVEVAAKVGGEVWGGTLEVTTSAEQSQEFTYTSSETTTSENTVETSTTTTTEVSRVRTLNIPAYTWIEAYDAVKSVDNVITPFVQKAKISGKYKIGSNAVLTGPEILTQIQFNFFEGVIHKVEDDNIEITIKGKAIMDELFSSSTGVNDVPGGCSN
ncbi:hypothetical protein VOI54_13825 [Tamlana sp. 2201CG12-4]|uniref:hypothetical protein n=1 Tax=Tamlana sp. 2201CG12-4 TaxID=3112582 RepID=UPI002DBF0EDB|nr:hypothetical protein [Tamlana sp. 2201CG12-4]MEC3908105.1 hypothetical protein [Tamlana sp. 2201CG12-4]